MIILVLFSVLISMLLFIFSMNLTFLSIFILILAYVVLFFFLIFFKIEFIAILVVLIYIGVVLVIFLFSFFFSESSKFYYNKLPWSTLLVNPFKVGLIFTILLILLYPLLIYSSSAEDFLYLKGNTFDSFSFIISTKYPAIIQILAAYYYKSYINFYATYATTAALIEDIVYKDLMRFFFWLFYDSLLEIGLVLEGETFEDSPLFSSPDHLINFFNSVFSFFDLTSSNRFKGNADSDIFLYCLHVIFKDGSYSIRTLEFWQMVSNLYKTLQPLKSAHFIYQTNPDLFDSDLAPIIFNIKSHVIWVASSYDLYHAKFNPFLNTCISEITDSPIIIDPNDPAWKLIGLTQKCNSASFETPFHFFAYIVYCYSLLTSVFCYGSGSENYLFMGNIISIKNCATYDSLDVIKDTTSSFFFSANSHALKTASTFFELTKYIVPGWAFDFFFWYRFYYRLF